MVSQIVGFSGYRPLTTKKIIIIIIVIIIIKLTISAFTESIEMAKYSAFTDGIRRSLSFTLYFAYSSPAFSFSFSLPFSSLHICRHIQQVHEFIAFFKISVCFCKEQLAAQLPAEKNAGCSTGFQCLICLHGGA